MNVYGLRPFLPTPPRPQACGCVNFLLTLPVSWWADVGLWFGGRGHRHIRLFVCLLFLFIYLFVLMRWRENNTLFECPAAMKASKGNKILQPLNKRLIFYGLCLKRISRRDEAEQSTRAEVGRPGFWLIGETNRNHNFNFPYLRPCWKCSLFRSLVGALSPANHEGLHQGWKQMSVHLWKCKISTSIWSGHWVEAFF